MQNPFEIILPPKDKFARFSQKLHEIKKVLIHRGAHARGASLDPPLHNPRVYTITIIAT